MAAIALPAFSAANPCGTWSAGRSRMTMAVDIDQNPPMATPSNARPIISAGKLGAKATIRAEAIGRPAKQDCTSLRSTPRVSPPIVRLVITAKSRR